MILGEDFYERPTLLVARELLGKYLVRQAGSARRVGLIVDVEAYVGPEDRASHASRGLTPRASIMFGPAGRAYVYLVYGVHHCLNVVTDMPGYPAAVLIRALEPVAGLTAETRLDGPGRVCRALEIDRRLNGSQLFGGEGAELWIEDRGEMPPEVATGPRIGVAYADEWARLPWRFWIAGSPFISRPQASQRPDGTGARRSPPARRARRTESRPPDPATTARRPL